MYRGSDQSTVNRARRRRDDSEHLPGDVVYERQAAKVLAVVQRFHDAFGVRFHGHRSLHDHVPRPAVVALPEHWTTENGVLSTRPPRRNVVFDTCGRRRACARARVWDVNKQPVGPGGETERTRRSEASGRNVTAFTVCWAASYNDNPRRNHDRVAFPVELIGAPGSDARGTVVPSPSTVVARRQKKKRLAKRVNRSKIRGKNTHNRRRRGP